MKILNWIFYAFLAAFFLLKAPQVYENFSKQGAPVPDFSYPVKEESYFLVFWATWCGPCSVELNRLNRLVEWGLVKPEQIIAFSIGESPGEVQKAVRERGYKFQVALDPTGQIAEKFGVRGTPTLVHVKNGSINWLSVGLSPTLEIRALLYL